MDRKEINDLIARYLAGESTQEERDLLYLWLVKRAEQEEEAWPVGEEEDVERRLRSGLSGWGSDHPVSAPVRWRTAAAVAASLLVLISVGLLLFRGSHKPAGPMAYPSPHVAISQIPPELSIHVDGERYLIDSLPIGVNTYVGGVAVRKTSANSIRYIDDRGGPLHGTAMNHRLFVPKGKDFTVTLVDGSVVWLNTESSLEFPAVFAGNERTVAMSGEAFFEVASDKTHPFKVATAEGAEVVATGTQFSVKAYQDEREMYTTLVEGAVTMNGNGESLALQPSQQAVSRYAEPGIQVFSVDVKGILAKKNGYFAFSRQDISSIMKEVSRWYDVDVYFQGKVSPRLFGGTFSRTRPLDELLEYFESVGGFKFKHKGRRLIVMS